MQISVAPQVQIERLSKELVLEKRIRLEGIEPPTPGSKDQRSNPLSYRRPWSRILAELDTVLLNSRSTTPKNGSYAIGVHLLQAKVWLLFLTKLFCF